MSKAGAVDARVNFNPNEVKNMEELLQVNMELKTLEKQKKELVEKVKGYMAAKGITDINLDGSSLSITESVRRTVSAKTKDEFIAALVSMGKKHLVSTQIEPDVDSIFAEVDAGMLQMDFVKKYINITPVTTLRTD